MLFPRVVGRSIIPRSLWERLVEGQARVFDLAAPLSKGRRPPAACARHSFAAPFRSPQAGESTREERKEEEGIEKKRGKSGKFCFRFFDFFCLAA